MAFPLTGRVAIITGSSRGIGLAIATHLASLGANLVINYTRSSTQADLHVSELNADSTILRAIAVQADKSDPSGPKTLFDHAKQEFGTPIHIFVNAAGIGTPIHIFVNAAGIIDSMYLTISSISLEDFDATFKVNTCGAFFVVKKLPTTLSVVVSSSLVGVLVPNFGGYVASKVAVEAMTKMLEKELKGTKITVNCVAPGATATDMFNAGNSEEMVDKLADTNPMERIGETKDIAPVVGFLCTDGAEWVNGQVIRVNGRYV